MFKQINKQPEVAYEVEEDQVIAGLVSKNFGIAVCPNMPILNSMNLKILQITSPNWERFFYLAVVKDRQLTPVAQKFKDFVIDNPELSTY